MAPQSDVAAATDELFLQLMFLREKAQQRMFIFVVVFLLFFRVIWVKLRKRGTHLLVLRQHAPDCVFMLFGDGPRVVLVLVIANIVVIDDDALLVVQVKVFAALRKKSYCSAVFVVIVVVQIHVGYIHKDRVEDLSVQRL